MGVAIVVAPAAARAAVPAAAVPAAVLVPVEIDGTARARAAKGKAREVTGGLESLRRASRVRERERERGKEVTAAAAAAAAATATATATAMLTTSTIIMVSHQTTLNRADDESALRLGIPKSASLVIWH
jgi:hypothetical protein